MRPGTFRLVKRKEVSDWELTSLNTEVMAARTTYTATCCNIFSGVLPHAFSESIPTTWGLG